jgi:hypothetical protein
VSRIKRTNIFDHAYTAVAEFVLSAMKGEAGRFGVYVAPCGTTNVCLLKHRQHNPRPPEEMVGVFTPGAPINVIEDALLERKRELSAQRRAA